MSTYAYRVLRCDADPYPGREQQCVAEQGAPLDDWSFHQLRKWLRDQGWHRTRDGRDICPNCWQAGQR